MADTNDNTAINDETAAPPVERKKPGDSEGVAASEDWVAVKSLASQGSADAQLKLGKHLLGDAADGQNEKTAVDWIIRASRQGNEEATHLLKSCLEQKKGIDESNVEDVRWCLDSTQFEKRVRLAARNLFSKLAPRSGDTFMSKIQFQEALMCVAPDKMERKMLEKAGKFKNTDSITVDEFVDRVVGKISGSGGLTVNSLLQSDVELEAYNQAGPITKLSKYPGKTLSVLIDHVLETASKRGMSWLLSLIPTYQIHMFIVFFLYSILSLQVILSVIPVFLFYISFFTMVICTMQMIYSKRKLRDIQVMTQLLSRFSDSVDSDTAESTYCWNKLTPYWMFFGGLCICVMNFAIAEKEWIPCSECVFVSVLFFVSCFFALNDRYDYLVILSVGFDLLSSLPELFKAFPRIPVVYHLMLLGTGSVFSVEIVPGLHLNFGFPSLAYVIIPLLFLRMAMQKSWQGTYRVLIPHLVCFFWWKVAVMFFTHSSWMGLIRGSFGWMALIVLLPLIGVGFIVTTAIYCVKIFSFANLLKVLTTITLILVPAALGLWAQSGFRARSFSFKNHTAKTKIILAMLSFFSIIPLVYILSPPERDVNGVYMEWDQYRSMCSQPAWEKSSMANAQVTCSHLQNMMVNWEGAVDKVVVAKIENQAEAFLDILPVGISDYLKCTYGEKYGDCKNANFSSPEERSLCQVNTMQGRECHMKRMNHYTFHIWVKMEISEELSQDVIVTARHQFRNIVLSLKTGDRLNFRSSLRRSIGGLRPELYAFHLKCTSCTDVSSHLVQIEKTLLSGVQKSVFSVFNFLMAPLIEFEINE